MDGAFRLCGLPRIQRMAVIQVEKQSQDMAK